MIKGVVLCVVLILAFSTVAIAQQTDNGSLSGSVKDQNGAVVPGATITAKSVETGLSRKTTANDEGRWTISTLRPGNYQVQAEASGFQPVPATAMVSAANTANVDLTVGLAGLGAVVDVVADGVTENSIVNTGSGGVTGSTVTGRSLEKQAVANRSALGQIQGETSASGNLTDPLGADNGNPEVSINGARTTSLGVVWNGIDATSVVGTGSLTENLAPAIETVQEVKLLTSLYDASLGRNGGGNVQLVTRSGGQNFAGSAYIYAQNEFFNANDFFFNRDGIGKQKARRLEGGFTVSGAVVKGRTFFFGGYQKTDALTAYVPTAQSFVVLPEALAFMTSRTPQNVAQAFARARRDQPTSGFNRPGCIANRLYTPADLVASPTATMCLNAMSPFFRLLTLRNPVTGDFVVPSLRPGFERLFPDPQNNVFFTNPAALGFPNGFPLTDLGRENGLSGGNPLVRQRNVVPAEFSQDQFTIRIDHVLTKDQQGSSINSLSGTFFFANYPGTDPFTDSTLISPFPLLKNDRNRTLAITDTHILSPNLVNEARFGYFFLDNSRELDARLLASEFTNETLGIPHPASFFEPGAASQRCAHQVGRGNLQDFSLCGPNDIFNQRKQLTLTFADNVTYTRNDHSLRFGVEYKRNAFDTSLPEEQGGELEKFDNFGQLLVGYVPEGDTAFGITKKQFRFNDLSFYVTDDWRISQRFQISIGVRWDWFGRPYEKEGRFTNFDPSLLTNPDDPRPGFILPANASQTGFNAIDASMPGITKAGNNHTLNGEDLNNFAPRFGFSFDPFQNGKTVIRGGYGIFYDRPSASFINTVYSNHPYLREVEERLESSPFAVPFNLLFRNQSTTRSNGDYLPFRVGFFDLGGNGTPYGLTSALTTGPFGTEFAEPMEFRAVERDLKTPLIQQWNLGIQQQIGSWVVEARYVGTRGQNLLLAVGFNQPYDLNDPNTPDYIFGRFNRVYEAVGRNDPLRAGASERQRGCGIAFGNLVNANIPGFPYPFGPQCADVQGAFDYNLDRNLGSNLGDARDFINAELRVPFLGFDPTDAIMLQSRGYSSYHAGQLNVTKRLTKGVNINASYTYSKSIDIGSTDPGSTTASGRPDTPNLGLVVQGDQRDLNANRAVSDFDRTHRFASSFVWELPGFRSQNHWLGGWQLSGFGQWQSGSPFTILGTNIEPFPLNDSSATSNSLLGVFSVTAGVPGDGGLLSPTRRLLFNAGRASGLIFEAAFGRPNLIDPALLTQRNCSDITRCYFNTNQRGVAVLTPAGLLLADPKAALVGAYGRFGNLGRNVLRGPAQKRVDLSLQKLFRFTETRELEFKWDVFNVFNFVNFANPNADLTDETDFGQITHTVGAPRVMQFGLKFRF